MPEESRASNENQLTIAASERASQLFDAAVTAALDGVRPAVEVIWPEGAFADDWEWETPYVVIGNAPAHTYVRRQLAGEVTDPAMLTRIGNEFSDMMGGMWADTLAYYDELDQLSEDIDAMIMPGSVYYDRAQLVVNAHGPEVINPAGTMRVARDLAICALNEFADRLEAA